MRSPFLLELMAVALVGAALGGCAGTASDDAPTTPSEGAYRGSEPPAGIRMPQFELRDVTTGEDVTPATLRGKAVLVTFVDTDCTDKCPLLASAMGEALRELPSDVRAQTAAVAISVNPLVDSRRSVVRFLRQRHAEALRYLVGSVAEMTSVWKRFGVVSAYETGDADTHSADVRVFNRDGIWVSTQHSGVDLTPANLAHDLELAVES